MGYDRIEARKNGIESTGKANKIEKKTIQNQQEQTIRTSETTGECGDMNTNPHHHWRLCTTLDARCVRSMESSRLGRCTTMASMISSIYPGSVLFKSTDNETMAIVHVQETLRTEHNAIRCV